MGASKGEMNPDGTINCPRCKSPMNIEKSRRRHVKRAHFTPTEWERDYTFFKQVIIGDCACGEYVFVHIKNEEK